MGTLPTVDQVRDWCQVLESACSNEQLEQVMAGEAANQAKACLLSSEDPDDRDDDLLQAFYRRCARQLAARGVPLGVTPNGEQGPMRLASFDAEIDRLEGHDRRFHFG